MLLAIDTSAGSSAAVVDGGRVLSEHSVEDTRRHAEVIGDLVVRSLADAKLAPGDLDGVAIGMGPGPFTGLRVGIAAAQTFAFGAGLSVLRVPSHDAVAFEGFSGGESSPVLVTSDARRSERYFSTYRMGDDSRIPRRIEGPSIAGASELDTAVTDYASYRRIDAQWISAGALGLLAELIQGSGGAFAGPEPLYLRSPDVTVATTTKRVTG